MLTEISSAKVKANHNIEGVAELKFWNFNVPYKAYMALTNVKTLQLWKFCNTLFLLHDRQHNS